MDKTMQSRRDFFREFGHYGVIGADQSLFPAWMPRLAFGKSAPANCDVLVCIFLRGGLDGLAAVAPCFEGASYYDRRPTQSVPEPGSENGGIELGNGFGLHPALGGLKQVYDAGDLAIVHATGLPGGSRSHFDAQADAERGAGLDKSVVTGWIGRHLQSAAWLNESPYRAVGIGTLLQASLRGYPNGLAVRSFRDHRFHAPGREEQLFARTVQRMYSIEDPQTALERQARLVFDTIELMQQLADAEYTPDNGAVYPDTNFGRALRSIAQLIKADVGLETARTDVGGWDTHAQQGTIGGDLANRLAELGNAMTAFYLDLGSLKDHVTLLTMSEFGRRVDENGSRGTDHGSGNVMFLMGGGVNGGQVFGPWPGLADEHLDDGDLAVTTDYRDILAEVVQRRLSNSSLDYVLPGHTVTPLGLLVPRA